MQSKLEIVRNSGLTIGMCHGVFDVLHAGHIAHFAEAKAKVDFLVVSVTADEHVKKGGGRPFFSTSKRVQVLEALSTVDLVYVSNGPTAVDALSYIRPDIYFKGKDYAGKLQADKNLILETECLKSWKGSIFFTQSLKLSTSSLIETVSSPFSIAFEKWIAENLSQFECSKLWEIFSTKMDFEIEVVGDFILDRYTFCKAIGKSGKEPLLAFEFEKCEEYFGGAAAVAQNFSKFVGKVSLNTLVDKVVGDNLIKTSSNLLVRYLNPADGQSRFIEKNRFVESSGLNKIFLEYKWKNANMMGEKLKKLKVADNSLIAISNFGHGLLSSNEIKDLISVSDKVVINSQLNAGSLFAHDLSTYKNCLALVLNRAELLWHFQSDESNFAEICNRVMEKTQCKYLLVTLGSDGLYLQDASGGGVNIPAIGPEARDRVGAGDALFVLATIAIYLGLNTKEIGLIANIGGALNIQYLGNSQNISPSSVRMIFEAIQGHLED